MHVKHPPARPRQLTAARPPTRCPPVWYHHPIDHHPLKRNPTTFHRTYIKAGLAAEVSTCAEAAKWVAAAKPVCTITDTYTDPTTGGPVMYATACAAYKLGLVQTTVGSAIGTCPVWIVNRKEMYTVMTTAFVSFTHFAALRCLASLCRTWTALPDGAR